MNLDYFSGIFEWINKIQDLLFKGAEILANILKLDPNNVFLIGIIILSFFIARRIMLFYYTTLEGRLDKLLLIAGGIFSILYLI